MQVRQNKSITCKVKTGNSIASLKISKQQNLSDKESKKYAGQIQGKMTAIFPNICIVLIQLQSQNLIALHNLKTKEVKFNNSQKSYGSFHKLGRHLHISFLAKYTVTSAQGFKSVIALCLYTFWIHGQSCRIQFKRTLGDTYSFRTSHTK